MNLMRIFDGPLGGKTLYLKPFYTAPGVLLKRKMNNFKKRKVKELKEKEELNVKIDNIKERKHDWLEN